MEDYFLLKSGDFLTDSTPSPSIPGIHFGFSYKSGSLDFLPKLFPGWWFGTFFIFPYIENVIIPIDELIFFRGVDLTTNRILENLQMNTVIHL